MSSELFTVCFWAGYEGNVYIVYIKDKQNKGSHHVNQWLWSILQKFRGFKLICKHYLMHNVKKTSIIIQMNQPIS